MLQTPHVVSFHAVRDIASVGKTGVHGTGSLQQVDLGCWMHCSAMAEQGTGLYSYLSGAQGKQEVLSSTGRLWMDVRTRPASPEVSSAGVLAAKLCCR